MKIVRYRSRLLSIAVVSAAVVSAAVVSAAVVSAAVVSAAVVSGVANAQDSTDAQVQGEPIASESTITPESMGFTPRTVDSVDGEVRFYLSTEGRPLQEDRVQPLVLYLDGSSPSALFTGPEDRLGTTLMFMPHEFPGYHFAVLSKPGIPFHTVEKYANSEEYERTLSLPWRVSAANAVLDSLAEEPFVDPRRILVVGHSEGADVAPWIAAQNSHVTHVAGLAPGGLSQMIDFVLFARKKVASGEMTQEEGDRKVGELKEAYRKIFEDPTATDKKWNGDTYLRWSTFFRPAIEAWRELEIPVYLGFCRDDENIPVECGEAIELEFIRLGKKNLTSTMWPADHSFLEFGAGEESEFVDHKPDLLAEVLKWAERR